MTRRTPKEAMGPAAGPALGATVVAVSACLLSFGSAFTQPASQAEEMPECGGLTALAQPTTRAVEVVNPGFEKDWTGWVPADQEGFSIVADPAAAHAGNACARFDCGRQTRYVPSLRQPLPEVGPGVYVLRFWLKLRDVGGEMQPQRGVRLSIEYLLQGRQRAWPSTQVFHGTRPWKQEELTAYVPANLEPGSVKISIHRYGSASGGEAFFDDFTLDRVEPPPVEAFLLHPNYRGYLPEDGQQTVRLWVRVNEPEPKGPVTVDVRSEADERVLITKTLDPAVKEQVVELDSSRWEPGRYLVAAKLGSYGYPAYLVHKISGRQREQFTVWFDSENVLHLRGQPTFPIGLYNTTRQFYSQNEDFDFEAESARLKKMAEAPVNVNVNYWFWSPGSEVRRRYLGAMAEHGIWYLDTVNNVYPGFVRTPLVAELLPDLAERENLDTRELVDRYLDGLAHTMRDVPAFLGWYVMDERGFADVPRHFDQYRVLRKADPGHPTFGVSNKPAELRFWRNSLDVVGLDPYPLMNMKAGRPLTLVAEWTRAAVEATRESRPVWMVLQFFQGWSTDRWPTEEELRTMSLMAIAEGARGVFYWSYGARALMWVKDPKQQEEYWQRLVKVAGELKSLEPALVARDAPHLVKAVSDPRIRWLARVAGGKCYVFAYMPSEEFIRDPSQAESVEVRFTLADGRTIARRFRPDFADWFAVTAPRRP